MNHHLDPFTDRHPRDKFKRIARCSCKRWSYEFTDNDLGKRLMKNVFNLHLVQSGVK
jgi:hypothetical protein